MIERELSSRSALPGRPTSAIRSSWGLPIAGLIVLLCLPASLILAETSEELNAPAAADTSDWTVTTGNKGSQRYAPLDQINASNVKNLEVAWTWTSPDVPLIEGDKKYQSRRFQPGSHEVTPLKIGDRLYVVSGYSQASAIDLKTGQSVWTYDPESYTMGRPTNLGFTHRGATYWEDKEGRGRIFYASGNSHLHAVDAQTGEPVGGFGENGTVDLIASLRRKTSRRAYTVSSPVVECQGTLVVGSSISDGPSQPEAPPGDVRGFDAETGKLLWTFHTIPQEGEFGNETWLNDSWKYTGNANVWTLMSADEDMGLVYLPIGTPTNDWYGGHRLGDNLFAESLVAVDCRTGKRKWHFQTTHHGLWDYDLVTSTILGDVTVDGKEIPGAFQLTKQGMIFSFHRETGEPIWPIEERAVPQSTLPGEQSSPTQPFPTKPPPYERIGLDESDLIDLTPELLAEAKEILKGFDYGPIYTPPNDKRPTLNMPGWGGGSSWQGGAFDPETGWLYVPSFTMPISVTASKPDASRSGFDYIGAINPMIVGPQGLPLVKPPWNRMTAFDMNKGEIVWMKPIGVGPQGHPALAGVETGPMGGMARSHVLVTDSLLFVNSGTGLGRITTTRPKKKTEATPMLLSDHDPGDLLDEMETPPEQEKVEVIEDGSRFEAWDKKTGEVLFRYDLPANTDGSAATFLYEGKQYIVMAMGGRDEPQQLIAFRLP